MVGLPVHPQLRLLTVDGSTSRPSIEVIVVPCFIPDPARRSLKHFVSLSWNTESQLRRIPAFFNDSLAKSKFEGARVWLFDYEDVEAAGPSLENPAAVLLEAAGMIHTSAPSRPIVFISHSISSFIVKQALVLARRSHSQGTFSVSLDCPIGIMFFGAPHRGKEGLRLEDISRRAFRHWACEIMSEEQLRARQHQKYSKALANWGVFQPLDQINSEFVKLVRSPQGEDIFIESFCEGRPVYRASEDDRDVYVFGSDVSTLGIAEIDETATSLNRNHFDLARFMADDSSRDTVSRVFRTLVQDLVDLEIPESVGPSSSKGTSAIDSLKPGTSSKIPASMDYDQPPAMLGSQSQSPAHSARSDPYRHPRQQRHRRIETEEDDDSGTLSDTSRRPGHRRRYDANPRRTGPNRPTRNDDDEDSDSGPDRSPNRHHKRSKKKSKKQNEQSEDDSEEKPASKWDTFKEGVDMTERVIGIGKDTYGGFSWIKSKAGLLKTAAPSAAKKDKPSHPTTSTPHDHDSISHTSDHRPAHEKPAPVARSATLRKKPRDTQEKSKNRLSSMFSSSERDSTSPPGPKRKSTFLPAARRLTASLPLGRSKSRSQR